MIYYCQLPINKILIVYIGSISVRYMNLYISFFSVLSLVHCVEFLQRDKCSLIYSKYILTNSLRHLIVSKPNMAQETEKTAEKFLTLHPKVIIRQTFGMFIQVTYVKKFYTRMFQLLQHVNLFVLCVESWNLSQHLITFLYHFTFSLIEMCHVSQCS